MKKPKKTLSPVVTIVTFVLGLVLLFSGSIGGARAALTYYSENYTSRVQMFDIGVTLLENGEKISYRDFNGERNEWSEASGALLEHLLPEGEKAIKLGQTYKEELKVQNTGTINQYVRVTIYKYWVDVKEETIDGETVLTDGGKRRDLDTDYIDLNVLTDTGWIEDTASSTDERTVLYYSRLLEAGQESALFADTLTINDDIATIGSHTDEKTVTRADGRTYTTYTTTYDYNGVKFCIEARVDAVQEHNAQDAIWSAWGKRVTITDGVLSLD